jgi:hypothetical protein
MGERRIFIQIDRSKRLNSFKLKGASAKRKRLLQTQNGISRHQTWLILK